jgi:hypothetical protein
MSLSRLLHSAGAPYAGKRIFWKIEEMLKKRNINPQDVDDQYYMYVITMLRQEGRYEECLEVCKRAVTMYPDTSIMFYYSSMALVDMWRALGDYETALSCWLPIQKKAENFSKRSKGIVQRARSELMFEMEKFPEALDAAEKSLYCFNEWPDSIESCVSMRCLAEALIGLGRIKDALPYLEKAYEFSCRGHHPVIIIDKVLYYLEKYFPEKVTIQQKITARCHQVYSPYSYLFGKKHIQEKTGPLPVWVEKQMKATDADCWLILENEILAMTYDKAIEKIKNDNNLQVFDFISGLVFENGKVADVLQEVQMRAMAAFIGNGDVGVSLWGVVDLIYREEPYNFNYGEERLKAIITNLKKYNLKVTREESYYFLRSPIPNTIFPMSLPTIERWRYLETQFPQQKKFQRVDVEALYAIEKTTAGRWLKNAQSEGVVVYDKDGYFLKT